MKLPQIQRMTTPGLALAHRHTALSFLAPLRSQADTVVPQTSLFGRRYIWSLSRFGKSLEQLAFGKKLRDLSEPEVDDGAVQPIVEPLQLVVYPEQPELESITSFWVTCDDKFHELDLFEQGRIQVRKQRKEYVVRWKPRKSKTQQPDENRIERMVIARTDSLAEALVHGTEWAEAYFPRELANLSVDANWLKDPATEKQHDLYFSLKGYGESGRPKDLELAGEVVSIRDLSKGQMSALITAALHEKRTSDWKTTDNVN